VIADVIANKEIKMLDTYKEQALKKLDQLGASLGAYQPQITDQSWQNQNIHIPTITTAQTYPTQSFQAHTLSKR
jgi:hypothetical protein